MANLLGQASSTGWEQSLHRSGIQNVLRSGAIIRSMSIDGAGRIELRVCDWDGYWECFAARDTDLRPGLARLGTARRQYIESGYDLNLAIPYCQTYFALLRSLLERIGTDAALRALLGLESFGIGWWGHDGAQAAGTITIRHPVYLLAKLREPQAYEDAKFLPVICPASLTGAGDAPLFYYYRQIKIQGDPFASLLVYPTVKVSRRLDSFGCVEAVSSAMSFKPDPRSKQRAKAITDWAVAPFLEHQRSGHCDQSEISFVDLGGGSGALLAEICKRLGKEYRSTLADRKFAWSIIDVSLQDATRRTHSRELRQHMSYLDYQPADYGDWIVEQSRAAQRKYDVALVCRLLNNLSGIDIESSSDPNLIAELSTVRRRPAPDVIHPADCLAGPSPDCRSLVASNARACVDGGVTFRQASLSDYFRGLHRISDSHQVEDERGLYFPVRRFNEAALILPDGSSMFGRLSELADLIVIEDVDLHADVLVEHLTKRKLDHLAASDATDRVRMQSASLLCMSRRELVAALPGRRVW
jgi:hypothetical protein